MKLKVTMKHIQAGKPTNKGECPLALALKDAGFSYAYVDDRGICADGKYCTHTMATSTFMRAFDDGAPVIAGTFFIPDLV